MSKDRQANEIMTRKLVTVPIYSKLTAAYDMMQSHRIRHLPVVDAEGTIVGILSDRDIQRAMKPVKAGTEATSEITFEFDPEFTVNDFMSWPVRSVTDDVPVRDIAQRMLNEKLSAILVVDASRHHRGIITTDDMLRLLIKLLDKDPARIKLALGAMIDEFSVSGNGHWA